MRFTFLFSVLFSLTLSAQDYSVSGKVQNNQEAIPFSFILLTNIQDSSVYSAYSDIDGKFDIQVPSSKYILKVVVTGYENYLDTISVSKDVRLKTIYLSADATELEVVDIEVEKSTVEMKVDKKVYNVGSDPNNAGSSAAEVLENVPSVTLDADGNLNLRGNSNVRILINGKPSGLTNMNSAEALQLLQGNMIESIEVITNPSSKYDAEGTTGIINIILKKSRKKGWNGATQITGGWPHNHSAGLNLTLNRKNIEWTLGANAGYRRIPAEGGSLSKYTGDTTFFFDRSRDQERGGPYGSFQMGADIRLDSTNQLNVLGSYYRWEAPNIATLVYEDLNESGEVVSISKRSENEFEIKENIEFGLGHVKKYKNQKGRWSTDVNWYLNKDLEDSELQEITPSDVINQRSDNKENEMSFLAQSDFTWNYNSKLKFETGVRNTYREVLNDFTVEEFDGTDWEILPSFTDEINYSENIAAAYMQWTYGAKKWSVSGGLRNEYSIISINQEMLAQPNEKLYNNLFPSFFVSRQLDSLTTIQGGYSKRINRPGFRSLLPFYSFTDNRSQYTGNPDLDPVLIDNLEVSLLRYWSKITLLSSVYYRRSIDPSERISFVDSEGVIRTQPVNLDRENAGGVEVNVNWKPISWWKFTVNGNVYYQETYGTFENVLFENNTLAATSMAQTTFTVFKEWDFNLMYNYSSPFVTTQGRNLKVDFFNLSIARDLLNDKGRITFSIRDVLNQRKYQRIVDQQGLERDSYFRPRVRMFLVSFNYKFSKKPPKEIKTRLNDQG
jgi:outer membrane receptor protein involved in Fe transport